MGELEPEPGAESAGVGDPDDEPRVVKSRAVVPSIQGFLVVLAEDGEVEQGLLRRQEPQVPGGQPLERGALAVVPVLRRHHRRAELLGEYGQVVVRDAAAGGLAADAQEDRPAGGAVVVEELEVALLEPPVVSGGEVVEALLHPPLVLGQVPAASGGSGRPGLGEAREEEGEEEGDEASARTHHRLRLSG